MRSLKASFAILVFCVSTTVYPAIRQDQGSESWWDFFFGQFWEFVVDSFDSFESVSGSDVLGMPDGNG